MIGIFVGSVLGIVGGKKAIESHVGIPKNDAKPPKSDSKSEIKYERIEVKAGSKNDWDKSINGGLKPHAQYELSNGHSYFTDADGRVTKVGGDLDLTKMDRNAYQQCTTGKCGDPGDEGGHLIASSLGGAGDKINIVPQSQMLNRGEWKSMENSLRQDMVDGKKVTVSIEVGYPPGGGARPNEFRVTAIVNGQKKEWEFEQ